ncbi:MAG: Hsp70 family protein [Thermodesulfobacteriota bacterium]
MEENNYRYLIGIDLGTSNTVVSYTHITDSSENSDFKIFDIPQIVKPGEILSKPLLPSFIFFPDENDKNKNRYTLPWQEDETFIVGEYARKRGGELPSRVISSAKSWLCNQHVQREEKILPWNSDEVRDKFSPVRAQTEILNHIKNAWNHRFENEPDSYFTDQNITVTIPASFDAVARELTLKACRNCGIKNLTLMEEPQAAFYSWLLANEDSWRKKINKDDLILVCDVGGGTSDFTLIKVYDNQGSLELERIAVGNHLLVGGDNIDLALSHLLNSKIASSGKKLNSWQIRSLLNKAREAKEYLFSNPDKESAEVIVHSKGMKLISGTVKSELLFSELSQIVNNGFFPECSKDEKPVNNRKTGLMEAGLNYESDPAVTKHLAEFLDSYSPSFILFNGGVMKSEQLREHIRNTVSKWSNENNTKELLNLNSDTSVAVGAAYYAWVKLKGGIRIKSGLNKTYYIEVASSMPAIPGIPAPTKAVCVAPFGMEEGSVIKIKDNQYMLTLGEEVSFNLLESSEKDDVSPGETVEDFQNRLEKLTEIETFLEGGKNEMIPVILETYATEVGTLEFYCASVNDDRKWKLEFNLRSQD